MLMLARLFWKIPLDYYYVLLWYSFLFFFVFVGILVVGLIYSLRKKPLDIDYQEGLKKILYFNIILIVLF